MSWKSVMEPALQVSENGQIAYHSGKDDKVAEEKERTS